MVVKVFNCRVNEYSENKPQSIKQCDNLFVYLAKNFHPEFSKFRPSNLSIILLYFVHNTTKIIPE